MKKWSQIDNRQPKAFKNVNVQQILEENLIVETDNVEFDKYVKIIGHSDAIQQIETYYNKKQIKENLLFLSEAKNYFLQGNFDYIDQLISSLQKQLSKLNNE